MPGRLLLADDKIDILRPLLTCSEGHLLYSMDVGVYCKTRQGGDGMGRLKPYCFF